MSEIKNLFLHYSRYFTGHILMLAGGFVSFPIFTRVFTLHEYGIMSLISINLVLVTAIAKLGINKGTARFYHEFRKSERRKGGVQTFFSTLGLGGLVISGLVVLVYILFLNIIKSFIKNDFFLNLLYISSVLIWTRSICTIFMSFLVSEEKSKIYLILNVFYKYLSVGLSVFFVFYLIKGLYGYYAGLIIAEFIGVLILLKHYGKNIKFSGFDQTFLKEVLLFGMPLIIVEFSGIFLTYGDRYILQFLRGSEEVGLYAAGYNLSTYCSELLLIPIGLSITPLYMKIWIDKGKAQTADFLRKTLKYFLMVLIPVIFGIISIGKDILILLASDKYAKASPVITFITAGILIYGCTEILGAGLYISKKTYIITYLLITATIVNLFLNILMIPELGLIGAAIATFITYIGLALARTYFSFKYLPFRICSKDIIKYVVLSLVMAFVINLIHIQNTFFNIFFKTTSGIFVYSFLIFITTKDIRKFIVEKVGYMLVKTG